MISKEKILCLSDYFIPGVKGGGPIRSISNMAIVLENDFEFYIVTRDRDLGDLKPYSSVIIGQWTKYLSMNILYIPFSLSGLVLFIRTLYSFNNNVIYLNSLFSWTTSILPLIVLRIICIKRHIVIAPRGELMSGALSLKSIKKKLFLKTAKIFGLYKGVRWHSTSDQESVNIKNIFGQQENFEIVQANNFVETGDIINIQHIKNRKIKGVLSLCLLSRISPKKNIDYAINCLSKINEEVKLSIYGPIEDVVYWKKCKAIIKTLPKNITINIKGTLEHENVIKTLSKHDAFFFPTKGENFGHVIFEAIKSGLPIITSDQTPWNYLHNKSFFWALSLRDETGFLNAITQLSAIKPNSYYQLRYKVVEMAHKIAFKNTTKTKYKTLLKKTDYY